MFRASGRALALAAAAVVSLTAAGQTSVPFSDTKLKNGLRVIISEDHTAPTVSVAVTYNVGSADETAGRTGFAHLFEHMMFKGSENVGPGEHPALIFNNGGTMNGTTNEDRTLYFETLPANQLELALFLEGDRMRSLDINKANLDNQRNAVQEERRLRVDNQPYGQTFERIGEQAYDNPAYKHSVIGSMDDLNAASVDDVATFFKTYYAPNNAVLSIVGDVDTKKTMALVEKYFGSIASQPQPEAAGSRRAAAHGRAPQHDRGSAGAAARASTSPGSVPPAGSPDYDALDVLSDVLSSGRSSRLNQVDRAREAARHRRARRLPRRAQGPGPVPGVRAPWRPARAPADVEAAIYEEIEKVKTGPIADWEIEKAHNSARRSQADGVTSTLQRAIQLGEYALFYNDPNLHQHAAPNGRRRSTAADVQRVAAKYLTKENRSVIITTPKPAAPKGGQQ